MALISFINPQYLLFLLLVPLFIFIHFFTLKSAKSTALKFANFPAISKIKGVDFFSKNFVVTTLSIIVLVLLVLSLSGMTFNTVINASSYSFVIALDSSTSMEADDFSPDRMSAAKEAALDFVDSTPIGTRIGVISFSGNALIEKEVVDDKSAVKNAIKDVVISDISGTDLYEAVITGTNLLKLEDAPAIILLSDGQINVGAVTWAINYANDNDVVVHTIGVGTEEGGITSFGLSKLDEDSLRSLAHNTDGEFFRAVDGEQLVSSFNNVIDKTPKKIGIDLSIYLLIVAILLFGLEYFLINSRYRNLV